MFKNYQISGILQYLSYVSIKEQLLLLFNSKTYNHEIIPAIWTGKMHICKYWPSLIYNKKALLKLLMCEYIDHMFKSEINLLQMQGMTDK